MSYLPIILKSERQHALLVGNDSNTAAKVRLLLENGVRVTVIEPGAEETLRQANLLGGADLLSFESRVVQGSDLVGITLFYVVGQSPAEQQRLLALGRSLGVQTTLVDGPPGSDFISPAIAKRGPISVAFSTGGAAPVFARRLRADIERILPQNLGPIAAAAGRLRDQIKDIIGDQTARRQFWDSLYDHADSAEFSLNDEKALEARIIAFARKSLELQTNSTGAVETGLVQLVGAGPGDPELLTIKAHRALQQADLIVYDKLVSDEVLSLARRDAEFIFVGKTKGNHGIGQDGINKILISEARKGRRVVRLKAGDPMVFGRAGEEIDAAREASVPLEIIPGVTALSGISSSTQIPLTHRDHAQAITLVTGQLKDGSVQNFDGLVGEGRTLAIYMGLSSAAEIKATLLDKGIRRSMPIAIIENGTRADERRFYGTVSDLDGLVSRNGIKSPGLIIIGETVSLAHEIAIPQPKLLSA